MKIAIICDVLGKANNGTVIATINLINYLRDKGHTVYVVSSDKTKEGLGDYFTVPTLNLGAPLNRVLKNNGVALAKPDKKLLQSVIEKADIVHLQIPFMLSRSALKIALRLNKPITASFHCQAENFTSHIGAINIPFINHLVYKNFYRKVYRKVDAIHYPTEFIRQVFHQHTRCEIPYYVISNGVNDDFFAEPPKREENEKFTIICAGRYSKEKAQAVLIRAVARSKYRDNIRVIFAGDGPMRKKLQRLSNKNNVECEYRFFSRSGLIDAFHGSDLYVHTAIIEIEAIACMEAIVCGLTAVISDSERSATRFFAVGDRTLFRKNDAQDLCEKIEYFYENRDKIEEYRKKYEVRSRAFGLGDCMEQMEKMLTQTVEKKRK